MPVRQAHNVYWMITVGGAGRAPVWVGAVGRGRSRAVSDWNGSAQVLAGGTAKMQRLRCGLEEATAAHFKTKVPVPPAFLLVPVYIPPPSPPLVASLPTSCFLGPPLASLCSLCLSLVFFIIHARISQGELLPAHSAQTLTLPVEGRS